MIKTGVWIVLIIVLIQLLINKKEAKDILLKAFTISSFVLAFIGVAQLFGFAFTKLPGQLIPYGTLGNRNIFVPSLLMTLPFTLYEIIVSEKGRWKLFAILSSLLNLIVVIVSGMRTTWIALAVALFAIAAIIILFNKKYSFEFSSSAIKTIKISLIVFVFIGAAGIVVLYVHSNGNKTKIATVLSMSSTNERTALWKKSLRMFADHPLNGVGVGNWRIQLPDYTLTGLPREAVVGEMHYQRPENDFVWVLAETGVTGFLSYAALFVFAFYYLLKRLKNVAISSKEKQRSLILFGGLILYVVVAFWGFPKERTYLSVELAVILALIIVDYQTEKTSSKKLNIHPVFFVLVLVFSIYKGNKLYGGEIETQKIIDARSRNDNGAVIRCADKALEYGYTIDPTSSPINFYKGVAYFAMNNIDSALSDFELARKVHPYHLHILNNLAACYEQKGNHTKAIECLNEALRISPDFQDALVNLSAAYYNTGNIYKAREVILKCKINIKNDELNKLNKVIEKKTNYAPCSSSGAYTEEIDLILNNNYTFKADTIADSIPAHVGDLYFAVLHELGHAHSLGHVNDPSALMYYFAPDSVAIAGNQRKIFLGQETSAINGGDDVMQVSLATTYTGCTGVGTIIPKYVQNCFLINNHINEITGTNELSIYPNPTSDYLIINITTPKKCDAIISIVDVLGQTLINKKVKMEKGETETKIDVSNLSAGIYFVSYNSENKLSSLKFIKQ